MLKMLHLYIISSHVKRNKTQVAMATINEQIRNVVKLLAKPANENEVTNLEKGIIVFNNNNYGNN